MIFRNPFGLRDDQIVMIEDISKNENGLRCNCVCPACGEPFEARMGDKRVHHFAHSGQGCDETNAYMMGLYLLIKEYLEIGNNLYLPAVIVRFPLSAYSYLDDSNIRDNVELIPYSLGGGNEEMPYSKTMLSSNLIQNIEIVKSKSGQPQVLLIYANNSTLAVRVRPPDTVCKLGVSTRYKEYSTLEVNLSSLETVIQSRNKEDLFHYLMSNTELFNWIYNPKMDKAFSKIKRRTKAYYDAAQENIKKQKEEQRKLEEQARIEAERKRLIKQQEEETKRREIELRKKKLADIVANPQLLVKIDIPIYDEMNKRLFVCEKCDQIRREDETLSYEVNNNIGYCRCCYMEEERKSKPN